MDIESFKKAGGTLFGLAVLVQVGAYLEKSGSAHASGAATREVTRVEIMKPPALL